MKIHSLQHYSHNLELAVHDAWITTKVKSALSIADPSLSMHINVKTYAGKVVLSGRVNTHRQCDQATALARAVHGVAEVDSSDLQTHVFMPGHFPEAPNAEESAEKRTQSSSQSDDK